MCLSNRFNHFLFTRINLLYRNTPRKRYNKKFDIVNKSLSRYLDPEWLESRLELFKEYCIPSVQNQTTKNFKWLLLMHQDTPDNILKKFKEVIPDNGSIILSSKVEEQAAQEGIKTFKPNTEFIITTNLDSDDGISKNFIQEIQNSFEGKTEFIDIKRGYVLDTTTLKIYNKVRKRYASPYRSLIEKNSDIKTIFFTTHYTSARHAPVRKINTSARWLQVVSGDNIANTINNERQGRSFNEIKDLFY